MEAALLCTTCGSPVDAPYRHYAIDATLVEACCDRVHGAYLVALGDDYASMYEQFWSPVSVRSPGEVIDV